MQLERVVNTAKAHTTGRWRSFLATSVAAGAVGLLSRFLVVLFMATVSLALTATVLAQQRAQNGAQAQGTAKTRPKNYAVHPFHNETNVIPKEANMTQLTTAPHAAAEDKTIRPFHINIQRGF